MGFNLWLVIFLALMPVFILFTGLSAANGFQSSADWQVIGIVLAAAIVTGYLAKRRGDEISKETSIEAGLMKDVGIPVGGSDPGKTLPTYLLHELHPSHLGHLNQEEMVAPAFRLSFVALSEALLPAQPHPRTPCLEAREPGYPRRLAARYHSWSATSANSFVQRE